MIIDVIRGVERADVGELVKSLLDAGVLCLSASANPCCFISDPVPNQGTWEGSR